MTFRLKAILSEATRMTRPRSLTDVMGRLRDHAAKLVPLESVPVARRLSEFQDHRYANGTGDRTYKLFVPETTSNIAMPLVVMLHGCHQSPDDFAAGTRMNTWAQAQGFVVAYPCQPASANPGKCWNWFNEADQRREGGEPSLIAGITRQIMRDTNIDPARVYIAGLSAGGAKAAIMGATYPDLFAAIGVHSGLACGAARDMGSAFTAMANGSGSAHFGTGKIVPTIVFHGDRDTTVNPRNGEQVIAQAGSGETLRPATRRGKTVEGVAYSCTVFATSDGRELLEHWLLHGGGHAWSGGSPAGSYTNPKGPDASREMVRFFLSHPMRV